MAVAYYIAILHGKSLTQFCDTKYSNNLPAHDDVIKWKHFPRNWPFVRGIHRSPVNSPHKGQWRGALMFTLICARINGWVNTREAGDLRRYRPHYDVIVMTMEPFQFMDMVIILIPWSRTTFWVPFKCILLKFIKCILITISLKFASQGLIDKGSALVFLLGWESLLNQRWLDSVTHQGKSIIRRRRKWRFRWIKYVSLIFWWWLSVHVLGSIEMGPHNSQREKFRTGIPYTNIIQDDKEYWHVIRLALFCEME